MFSRVPTWFLMILIGPVFFILGLLSLATGYFPSRAVQPLSPAEARLAGLLLTCGSGTFSLVLLSIVMKRRR